MKIFLDEYWLNGLNDITKIWYEENKNNISTDDQIKKIKKTNCTKKRLPNKEFYFLLGYRIKLFISLA